MTPTLPTPEVVFARPGSRCPSCYKATTSIIDHRSNKLVRTGIGICNSCGALMWWECGVVRPLTPSERKRLPEILNPQAELCRAEQDRITANMIG